MDTSTTSTDSECNSTTAHTYTCDNIKHHEWLESIEEYWQRNEEHNKIICRGRLLSKEKHKELPIFLINVINKTMNRRMMNGRN
jgi:DNA replication protein DnaC